MELTGMMLGNCCFNAIRQNDTVRIILRRTHEQIQLFSDSSSKSTSSRKRRSSDDVDDALPTTYGPTPTDDAPTPTDYWDDYSGEGDDDDYDPWGDEEVEDPDYLDPEFFASEKVSLLLAGKDETFLSSLGHQFEDMVLSCTYRGISCR